MASQPFTTLIRKEFSFHTCSKKLNQALQDIASKDINITAMAFFTEEDLHVALVVGLALSIEKDEEWGREVKSILKKLDIKYSYRPVVQIITEGSPTNVPGIIAAFYDALLEGGVKVCRLYFNDTGGSIVRVSNVEKAVKIINAIP